MQSRLEMQQQKQSSQPSQQSQQSQSKAFLFSSFKEEIEAAIQQPLNTVETPTLEMLSKTLHIDGAWAELMKNEVADNDSTWKTVSSRKKRKLQ
jgi:hypothetical protein